MLDPSNNRVERFNYVQTRETGGWLKQKTGTSYRNKLIVPERNSISVGVVDFCGTCTIRQDLFELDFGQTGDF